MSIDEMIAVLQVYKAGKKIQLASRNSNPRKWCTVSPLNHEFNFISYDYRVKPEPLVIYANVYTDFDRGGERIGNAISHIREEVLAANGACDAVRRGAKFVEVIE